MTRKKYRPNPATRIQKSRTPSPSSDRSSATPLRSSSVLSISEDNIASGSGSSTAAPGPPPRNQLPLWLLSTGKCVVGMDMSPEEMRVRFVSLRMRALSEYFEYESKMMTAAQRIHAATHDTPPSTVTAAWASAAFSPSSASSTTSRSIKPLPMSDVVSDPNDLKLAMADHKPFWLLSSCGVERRPTIVTGLDESPEEMRVRAVMALKFGEIKSYHTYELAQFKAAEKARADAIDDVAFACTQADAYHAAAAARRKRRFAPVAPALAPFMQFPTAPLESPPISSTATAATTMEEQSEEERAQPQDEAPLVGDDDQPEDYENEPEEDAQLCVAAETITSSLAQTSLQDAPHASTITLFHIGNATVDDLLRAALARDETRISQGRERIAAHENARAALAAQILVEEGVVEAAETQAARCRAFLGATVPPRAA